MVLPSFAILLNRAILSCILIAFDSLFFIGGYSTLCVLRVSVNWAVWFFGYLIIVASVALCYVVSTPTYSLRDVGYGNVLGVLSFGIVIYAAIQWVSRRWYVFIKKRALPAVVQGSRNFFLFVRKHHTFFGWIVVAAAVAHMVVFLPILANSSNYEIVTGFIAIGILTLLVLLGVWIWYVTRVQKERIPKLVHAAHSILTIVFLVALAVHI